MVRVAWFTPLSSLTGIARYSAAVVPRLAGWCSVEVWAPACVGPIEIPGVITRTLESPEGAADATRACDLRIYNLGNNAVHHAGIYETARRSPGIAILHDRIMQDFHFNHLPPADYYRLMSYCYGPRGAAAALEVIRDPSTLAAGSVGEHFPLFEPCLFRAQGAVVHSAGAASAVGERYGDLLPVHSRVLPRFGAPPSLPSRDEARDLLGVPRGVFLVVATGRLAPNKRVEDVIDAVAQDASIRDSVWLASVGAAEAGYAAHVRARADSAGIGRHVRLVTEADDELMARWRAAADVFVNLRRFSTESGSASLIEQMAESRPVIVSNVGVYSEVPDDAVVKVDQAQGASAIALAIRRMLDSPGLRESIGLAAAGWVEAECDPDAFAVALNSFLEGVVASRSRLEDLDLLSAGIGRVRDARALEEAAAKAIAAG